MSYSATRPANSAPTAGLGAGTPGSRARPSHLHGPGEGRVPPWASGSSLTKQGACGVVWSAAKTPCGSSGSRCPSLDGVGAVAFSTGQVLRGRPSSLGHLADVSRE